MFWFEMMAWDDKRQRTLQRQLDDKLQELRTIGNDRRGLQITVIPGRTSRNDRQGTTNRNDDGYVLFSLFILFIRVYKSPPSPNNDRRQRWPQLPPPAWLQLPQQQHRHGHHNHGSCYHSSSSIDTAHNH
jgi:hypothetical protein